MPSLDALRKLYLRFATAAADQIERDGQFAMQALFMHLPPEGHEPLSMTLLDAPSVADLMAQKDLNATFVELVEQVLDPLSPLHEHLTQRLGHRPNVVLHMFEAWYARTATDTEDGVARRQELEIMGVEQAPDREEGVFLNIYSERGMMTGICPIVRDEIGRASLVVTPLPEDYYYHGTGFGPFGAANRVLDQFRHHGGA